MDRQYGQTQPGLLTAHGIGSSTEAVLACLLLFAGALLVRLIDLNAPPEFDELYTVLAAKGWLLDGEPRIAEGSV
jgi:hypothetical protein